MAESKQEESFKVVDRRLFTAEGELRKDVAEQQDREREAVTTAAQANRSADNTPSPGAQAPASKLQPEEATLAKDAPKRSSAFENLIRSLGQNAAMLLGGYADPRTGQPMVDLEGAREIIDMMDALREKTRGQLAPEEDSLMLDIAGNLKLAYMEMTKAASAAAASNKAKSRT